MRIGNSKPLNTGPTLPGNDASSKLGEVNSVSGSTEGEAAVKYTLFLPDGTPQLAAPAGAAEAEAFRSVSGIKTDTADFTSKTLPANDGVTVAHAGKSAIAKSKLAELSMSYVVKSSELSTQMENASKADSMQEPTSIEFPNLSAGREDSVYQHNQTNLEFVVPKKTGPKE